jgi:alanyl-tRNA synthetase
VIHGSTVFKLYDTYGFPVDLTADVAREHDLTLDMDGFEQEMEQQRQRARASGSFSVDYNDKLELSGETAFTGYDALKGTSKVVGLFKAGEAVNQLSAGETGVVVLDHTAFYAESGGQAGDKGTLAWDKGSFAVTDCTKESKNHLHHGKVSEGVLCVGDAVSTDVDALARQATALNHSATHLLHAALRTVLGEHVQQKGSLVNADRLRFDFAHFEAMTAEEIAKVESMVNAQIRANSAVETEILPIEQAKQKGAMALFGEKYDDEVRVLSMGGDFSIELCGGTHAKRTGDIGFLKVISESGIASGVRRIEAVTGEGALSYLGQLDQSITDIAAVLKGAKDTVVEKVKGLSERNRQLEKELEQLQAKLAAAKGGDLLSNAVDVNGIKVLAAKLDGVEAKALRDTIDQLKNKLGSAVVVLATESEGKISLAAGVTQDLVGKIKAGDIVRELTEKLGGKGGGRPDFAQGGGTDSAALPAALESVKALVANS